MKNKKKVQNTLLLTTAALGLLSTTNALAQVPQNYSYPNPTYTSQAEYENRIKMQNQERFRNSRYKPRSGSYLGLDLMRSFAKHKYLAMELTDAGEEIYSNGFHSTGEDNGAGINWGYKFSSGTAFVAPELFYDHLDNSANDFGYEQISAISENRLVVDNRYGAKLNIGYTLATRLNTFITLGVSNIKYTMDLHSINKERSGTASMIPLYGFGFSYDVNNEWALKLAYDWQQFSVRFNRETEKDRIMLQSLRFGIAYKF